MPNFVSPKDRGSPCGEEVLNKMTLGTVHKVGQKARPISARGNSLVQLGNESTATTNGASLAVAFNRPGMEGSTAEANGTGNFVVAGNNGHAQVTGNFNGPSNPQQ